jgi:glycosyltransferase involved in cell wall biosynthesis
MMSPMFSIVIRLFNKRHTVRASVESVSAQDFRDWELMIVDDGSSDDSAGALADLLDPGVKIVRQPNGGSALARNRGIALAAHEWVAFIDNDDLWLPYHLNELNSIRIQFPGADLIGTSYIDYRQ